jgi:hypothetical protein
VLQSSILNYNTNCSVTAVISISCFAFLPSYAATGAWFNLVTPPQPVAQIPAYMNTMRSVAVNQYDPAVAQYLRTPSVLPSSDLVNQLIAQTGVIGLHWFTHFNMDNGRFHDSLIAGSELGYYDARMAAAIGTPLDAQGDPSTTMYESSFASTIVSYLSTDLHYTTPSAYTMLSNAIDGWNFRHNGQQLPDTIPDLAAAMAHNPRLKVFSANGYYDIVTPFFGTEGDLTRLGYPSNGLITTRFYQGGHMTYLDDVGRTAEKADLAAFYHAALAKREVPAGTPMPMTVAAETPAPRGGVMPAAVFEHHRYDPMLPPSMANVKSVPATQGVALAAQVEQTLRDPFDAAKGKQPGVLTRDEARAAGLGYIAKNFDAIDVRRTGAVSFDDVKRFMRSQGATLPE